MACHSNIQVASLRPLAGGSKVCGLLCLWSIYLSVWLADLPVRPSLAYCSHSACPSTHAPAHPHEHAYARPHTHSTKPHTYIHTRTHSQPVLSRSVGFVDRHPSKPSRIVFVRSRDKLDPTCNKTASCTNRTVKETIAVFLARKGVIRTLDVTAVARRPYETFFLFRLSPSPSELLLRTCNLLRGFCLPYTPVIIASRGRRTSPANDGYARILGSEVPLANFGPSITRSHPAIDSVYPTTPHSTGFLLDLATTDHHLVTGALHPTTGWSGSAANESQLPPQNVSTGRSRREIIRGEVPSSAIWDDKRRRSLNTTRRLGRESTNRRQDGYLLKEAQAGQVVEQAG